MPNVPIQLQWRRDTAANWTANNPVLADGEPGWDKTRRALRIGDGLTAWNDLADVVLPGTPA